jgi:hypothetical protein
MVTKVAGKTINFDIDAFRWKKHTNELVSIRDHFHRSEIPMCIVIHGRTKSVLFNYKQWFPSTQKVEYVADQVEPDHKTLPKVYVGYS